MTEDTLVFTDSPNSLCFNGDPWGFLVHPGRRDKLLFYFPGGGACFSSPNFLLPDMELCSANMSLGLLATGFGWGILDWNDNRNHFKDYTVVAPTYCDGSLHSGNITKQSRNGPRYQYGYNNVQFAKNWAKANVNNVLNSFVMLGTSAGSLGAATWADTLLSTFSYRQASVIMDSYTAVFPWGTPGRIVQEFGLCDLPIIAPLRSKCLDRTFDFTELVDMTIQKYPNVAFASLQSKADEIQILFYRAVAAAYFVSPYITESQFYYWSNVIMERYNKHPNYVAYNVEGQYHTLIAPPSYYTTSTLGHEEPNSPKGTPLMPDWISQLVRHQTVKSECSGSALPNGARGASYCDQMLYPKKIQLR